MTYQIFQYRLPMEGQPEDLNKWLASHRIVSVRSHLVQGPEGALLVFVVESTGNSASKPATEPRVDYKETLSESDFLLFSRLRQLRKEVAEREGVPVYAVFSNAQLAEMVERRVSTSAELSAIDGVGQGRVTKHGPLFLSLLVSLCQKEGESA